jgi:hypothetical protein
MYRLLTKPGARNPNPISSEGRAIRSSRQAKDFLLCDSCEQRFHSLGEDWVMRNCYRGAKRFRLRESIMLRHKAKVLMNGGSAGYRLSDMPELDSNKLVYFAMSVFWRAGVHVWRLDHRTVSLQLGPYLARIGDYLMGGPFPRDVALFVRFSNLNEDCRRLEEPVSKVRSGYQNHIFYMAGLDFTLSLGKAIPASFIQLSTAPGGIIAVNLNLDAEDLKFVAKVRGEWLVEGKLPWWQRE